MPSASKTKQKRKHPWIRMYVGSLIRIMLGLLVVLAIAFIGTTIGCDIGVDRGYWEGRVCLYSRN